jgi:hypothetical protein
VIKEHDMVAMAVDRPEVGLKSGDIGTVVFMHDNGRAYEVEFVAGAVENSTVVTLDAAAVRSIQPSEIERFGATHS